MRQSTVIISLASRENNERSRSPLSCRRSHWFRARGTARADLPPACQPPTAFFFFFAWAVNALENGARTLGRRSRQGHSLKAGALGTATPNRTDRAQASDNAVSRPRRLGVPPTRVPSVLSVGRSIPLPTVVARTRDSPAAARESELLITIFVCYLHIRLRLRW